MMRYSSQETMSHEIAVSRPNCVEDFNALIYSEDENLSSVPAIFKEVKVINVDRVKNEVADEQGADRLKSVDATFAVSDGNLVKMLLVELRLNYKGVRNLRGDSLREKVDNSIRLLGKTKPINDNFIFIFQPDVVQQARNRLRRMNPSMPENYITMDLYGLISAYFPQEFIVNNELF